MACMVYFYMDRQWPHDNTSAAEGIWWSIKELQYWTNQIVSSVIEMLLAEPTPLNELGNICNLTNNEARYFG